MQSNIISFLSVQTLTGIERHPDVRFDKGCDFQVYVYPSSDAMVPNVFKRRSNVMHSNRDKFLQLRLLRLLHAISALQDNPYQH